MSDPDVRPRLTGQGNYGPLRIPYTTHARLHLWNHVTQPPAQNTVIVMKDGTVIEGNQFEYEDLYGPNVHRAFIGGYRHVCNVDEDPLSWQSLQAAGYKCEVATQDIYIPSDTHTTVYPLVDGMTDAAARAAALEEARLRQIASLEAELAALKGTP